MIAKSPGFRYNWHMGAETFSPELARYREPAKESKSLPIGYKEPRSGQVVPVFHPEILGMEANSKTPVNFDALIQVKLPDRTVNTSFGDYLQMNGINYQEYKQAFKPGSNNKTLVRELHQRAINQRLTDALAAEKTEGTDWEGQEQTKKDVETFLSQLVESSGYGETTDGTLQNDHKDKIDFFLKVDPADFEMEGDPVYFGIQHTLSENWEKINKKRKIASDHKSRYIPEHPEYGRVTNVVFAENRRNYFPHGGALSHEFTLNRLNRKDGKNHKAYEAFMYNENGKRNDLSPDQAKAESLHRVFRLYKRIQSELNEYIFQAKDSPATKKDLLRKVEVIDQVLKAIEEGK